MSNGQFTVFFSGKSDHVAETPFPHLCHHARFITVRYHTIRNSLFLRAIEW